MTKTGNFDAFFREKCLTENMHCYLCHLAGDADRLELREHSSAKWLTRGALDSVCWLPADQGLVDKLKEDDEVWEVTT